MDELHSVLRAIRPEVKSAPDHLSVFREFLAHLDALQRQAPARPRKAAARKRPARRATSPVAPSP